MNKQQKTTDLPVMLPVGGNKTKREKLRLKPSHGLVLASVFILSSTLAYTASEPAKDSVLDILMRWVPLLLNGFIFNIVISVCAMAVGTVAGAALGLGQISLNSWLRKFAWFVTQFFRNSP
jgi:polar amino acid transport system permease protein